MHIFKTYNPCISVLPHLAAGTSNGPSVSTSSICLWCTQVDILLTWSLQSSGSQNTTLFLLFPTLATLQCNVCLMIVSHEHLSLYRQLWACSRTSHTTSPSTMDWCLWMRPACTLPTVSTAVCLVHIIDEDHVFYKWHLCFCTSYMCFLQVLNVWHTLYVPDLYRVTYCCHCDIYHF